MTDDIISNLDGNSKNNKTDSLEGQQSSEENPKMNELMKNLLKLNLKSMLLGATHGPNNIYWSNPFTSTEYWTYIKAFQTGFRLNTFSYSSQCVTSASLLLNDVFYYQRNLSLTPSKNKHAYNISLIISGDFANSFLNCYLFETSFVSFWEQRISSFAGFTDFYTSFLFNLLSNSLLIRTLTTGMNTA